MAKQLESFKFRTRGRVQKYPWNEWLDGSIWELKKGEDFTINTRIMRNSARSAADRRRVQIRTQIPNENTLIIQAYHKSSSPDATET